MPLFRGSSMLGFLNKFTMAQSTTASHSVITTSTSILVTECVTYKSAEVPHISGLNRSVSAVQGAHPFMPHPNSRRSFKPNFSYDTRPRQSNYVLTVRHDEDLVGLWTL